MARGFRLRLLAATYNIDRYIKYAFVVCERKRGENLFRLHAGEVGLQFLGIHRNFAGASLVKFNFGDSRLALADGVEVLRGFHERED